MAQNSGFGGAVGSSREPWRAVGFWAATAHLALDLLIALLALPLVIIVIVGAALTPVFLFGLPMLVGGLWALKGFAAVERLRFAATLDLSIGAPHRPRVRGPVGWSKALLRDRSAWRALLYAVLLLPVGAITFSVVVGVWTTAVAMVLMPGYYWLLPSDGLDLGIITISSWIPTLLIAVVAALAAAGLIPVLTRLMVAVDIALAVALLGPGRSAVLTERVVELTQSRSRVVDAAEQERRRMERDLHDGAQQRLVAMSMVVGRLSSRLRKAGDLESAELADQAQGEVRQAIVELRDLTRGLHPPVLSDRGLDAALSAVAARSPVPVMVHVDLPERPSLTAESIAYFFVCEALANVAKHSGASHATVMIRRDTDRLYVTVTDDGHGGADPRLGSGLAGLADRAGGVDGAVALTSPLGGPTVLELELPCAS